MAKGYNPRSNDQAHPSKLKNMRQSLISALLYTLANAIGLSLAALLLPGFSISISAIIFATILFTVIEVILGPLISKLAKKRLPALEGGIALVTTFAGLFLTSILTKGMQMGGLVNWVLATLLVWLGALIAGIILPRVLFKATEK